ncbi:MAG: DEAD/DEAH box helicase [Deltaproteobacteria bacterium]|nr:DEAD/DEAH box helicase [Deltaproteobacteria bacterium]
MPESSAFPNLPPAIAAALTGQGFTELTPIQARILNPSLEGRDLRLASKTGSGKTVAVGLLLARRFLGTEGAPSERANCGERSEPAGRSDPRPGAAKWASPEALVIAPTRELAAQLQRELSWLLWAIECEVAVVAGGASYRDELRALHSNPRVIVGTPGRLRDHLSRGAIDPARVATVVLDEADQMLDLGFRDELEEILSAVPAERRTHMVSATFPREVLSLAQRFQREAVMVEGTQLGSANDDIAHVVHFVRPDEREAALVNLLLLAPEERALLFVRTRAGASELTARLEQLGFRALALSGELEQKERNQALAAFRAGVVKIVVATDVAARGLDIPEVGRVIHVDLPDDSEALTHRSGRTGRAGRKGTSVMLVAPSMRERARNLLRRARIEADVLPIPTAARIADAADERFFASFEVASSTSPRTVELAARLLKAYSPEEVVAALLERSRYAGPCEPREVNEVSLARPRARPDDAEFVPFGINWGDRDGADPRRLLAMLCRRGEIQGQQVGAIRIGRDDSTFEIHGAAVQGFRLAISRPDPNNAWVRINALRERPTHGPKTHPFHARGRRNAFMGPRGKHSSARAAR